MAGQGTRETPHSCSAIGFFAQNVRITHVFESVHFIIIATKLPVISIIISLILGNRFGKPTLNPIGVCIDLARYVLMAYYTETSRTDHVRDLEPTVNSKPQRPGGSDRKTVLNRGLVMSSNILPMRIFFVG